jgi:hypothetical protein
VLDVDRKVARFVPGMRLRVPRGTVAILTGQQGVGKGLLEVLEAAGVAKGGGAVLIASDEDSVAYTIRPRLEAATGGDRAALGRIHIAAHLTLPDDIDAILLAAGELDARLLIVDPWTNHVGDIDLNKTERLRPALMALAEATEQGDFATILTAHPNKNSENPDPLERIAHSQALTQVSRSCFQIVRDPREDATEHARIVNHFKHNLTARQESIEYTIETVVLEAPHDVVPVLAETGTNWLDWLELHKLRKQRESEKVKTAKLSAEQLIIGYLMAAHEGRALASIVRKALVDDHDISTSSIDRAAKELDERGKITRTGGGLTAEWKLETGANVRPTSRPQADVGGVGDVGQHQNGTK